MADRETIAAILTAGMLQPRLPKTRTGGAPPAEPQSQSAARYAVQLYQDVLTALQNWQPPESHHVGAMVL